MGEHYKQKKEEKTLELVKRACNFLVDAIPPVKLNGKLYKKIHFSHGQVKDCMHFIANLEERAEGILFNDPTTFTHNKKYKAVIADGKLARQEKEAGKLNITFKNGEPDVLDMKLMIDSMAVQIDALKEKNASLEAIIRNADLQSSSEKNSGPVRAHKDSLGENEQKIKKILENVLVLLNKEYMLRIDPKENGKSPVARLDLPNETSFLCNLSDLVGLELDLKKDSNGRMLLDHKESTKEIM